MSGSPNAVVEFQTSSNVVVEGVPHYGVRVSRGKLPRLENQHSWSSIPGFRQQQGQKPAQHGVCSYFEDIGPSHFLHHQACLAQFPTVPSQDKKNRKAESHAEEALCSAHAILFTALSATPYTFTSFSKHHFHVSPVAPQPRAIHTFRERRNHTGIDSIYPLPVRTVRYICFGSIGSTVPWRIFSVRFTTVRFHSVRFLWFRFLRFHG